MMKHDVNWFLTTKPMDIVLTSSVAGLTYCHRLRPSADLASHRVALASPLMKSSYSCVSEQAGKRQHNAHVSCLQLVLSRPWLHRSFGRRRLERWFLRRRPLLKNGCVDEFLRHITCRMWRLRVRIDNRRAGKVCTQQTSLGPPSSHGMWLSYHCIRVVPDVSAHDLHRVVIGALEFSFPLGIF